MLNRIILEGNKIVKKLLVCIFLITLLTACQKDGTENIDNGIKEKEEVEEVKLEIPNPEHYMATISAIGDILIHSSIYQDAYMGNNQYDFTKMFTNVKPFLQSADIAVANSESVIGGQELGLSTYPRFNSPYEVGDALKDAGIDVVNLANNHILDRGEQAIINATNYWNQLGITYVGVSPTKEEADNIKTVTVNHITFSFLGYTYGTNGLMVPEGKEYLVHYIDKEKMPHDIERAKEVSDVVVVNLHMGIEYARHFNEEQADIAQFIADQGAHIIFAHHPHVLQPVKWYEGIHGNKTFVIHSLGNFLSAQDRLYRQIGAILQLEVTKDITYNEQGQSMTTIEISKPTLVPTYVKFQNWRNYEILPMYQLTNADLNNVNEIYDEIKQHMSQYVHDLEFLEQLPN